GAGRGGAASGPASIRRSSDAAAAASSKPRACNQACSSATLRSLRASAPRAASNASSARSAPGPRSGGLALRGRRIRRIGRRRSGALDHEGLVELRLDLRRELGVLGQVLLGVVAALAEAQLAVGEERARLLDDVVVEREVEQASLLRDSGPVLDVELGLLERRRDLVLDDLDPDPVADRLRPLLQGLDPADVETLRAVELESPPAGLG